MRFTDIRDHELPTGRLTMWVPSDETMRRSETAATDSRRPSDNQHGHIAHAMARRVDPDLITIVSDPTGEGGRAAATGWLGICFDVAPTSTHGLRRSLETWMRRHETLRSGFRPASSVDGPDSFERFTLPAADVHLEAVELGRYDEPGALAERLDDLFNASTDAICWPAFAFAAIWSANATTVVLAFDHLNVDGYSILLMAAELREMVDADREGRPPHLPAVPSYLDFVEDELDVASTATGNHDAVQRWRQFLGEEHQTPSFPLPDGLAPGSQVPQTATCTTILTESEAATFGAWCRASGISTTAGFLGVLALAFRRLDPTTRGSDEHPFRALVSTHTRHDPRWAEALGWFTAVAPFAVTIRGDSVLIDVLDDVDAAWSDAKVGARLPMARVGSLLGRPIEPRFVVSYLDARHVRGAARWADWNAGALIGDVGPTDQVYLWINRMPTETYLTWRFPGNDVCRDQVQAVNVTMSDIIHDILDSIAISGPGGAMPLAGILEPPWPDPVG